MIKIYLFDYDFGEASARFKVDTEKFRAVIALSTLEFFSWDYDRDADPVDEVLKKYALRAIFLATANNYSLHGVRDEFKNQEGFCKVDGSMGIELTEVSGYEFDESALEMTIGPE